MRERWVVSSAVNYGRLAALVGRVEDDVGALVCVDHGGARLVDGWDVGGLANTMEHSSNRVVPATSTKALAFCGAEDLVVAVEVEVGNGQLFSVEHARLASGRVATRAAKHFS